MVKMKNTKNPKRSHNTNFMLGEFSLLPYSVISAKKNKQSIKIHTINNINTITKYKEFKEKKVYLLEMRILQHLSDKKINNGQNEKYKKSKKKP